MKKQNNSSIKAHFLRSAFYVLLLIATCAIPFALAQRNQRTSGSRSLNVARPSFKQQTQAGKKSPVRPRGDCPVPWEFVASMPLDLYGAGCASDGTFAYCGGGYSFSVFPGTVAVFNRYDPVANTWTPLPDMPQAALMPVAVYYAPTNKIYVFGGEDGDSGVNYDITRIYDIATNTWSTGASMPDVRSFMAGGYVAATGKIYILSGYNTGDVTSAQPNTWEYDPAANTWTDLTATAPYPHPAGGFAYGVINNKIYISGGRDSNNFVINDTWEFTPAGPSYTQKADMPGSQPNVPGSAVALDALFSFGGGNPFLASVPASVANSVTDTRSPSTTKPALSSTKTAPVKSFDPATLKHKALVPATTSRTNVYIPAMDTWRRSANLNTVRAFTSGAFISGSNEILCAGGEDGFSTLASAEITTPCIPPPPTPCPSPTPTPLCGLLIGDGLAIGFEPNGYQQIASNMVSYSFSSSVSAPNEYAIFETHNPWDSTVIKDAIAAAGHTYTVFTPEDLAGFNFSQYRVVILNWDDTFLSEFGGNAACGGGGAYIDAIPALEAYAAAGGVLWVQGAVQGDFGDCFPLPFGGESCIDFAFEDPIVQTCHPMVVGVENPIEGNYASHTSQTGLPPASSIVVINGDDSNPVLYDLACPIPRPTPTPTPPLGCNTGLIHNGGFETGNFTNWVVDGLMPSPVVTNALAHSGRFSAFVGGNPPGLQFCGFGDGPNGDSSFYQQFGPVPANATLSFWHWDCNTSFSIDFAWQDAYITDTDGNILQTIYHQLINCESWINERVDLTPWVGQTIRVKFLVRQDGFGDLTSMVVDDVGIFASGCTPTPTPTPRATSTPRPRPTPMPRP